MKRLICNPLPKKGERTLLSEEEAHHASQVLRLSKNAWVIAIDGEGGLQVCQFLPEGKKSYLGWVHPDEFPPVAQAIVESYRIFSQKKSIYPITLEIALIKKEAMEWVIEKAVELGAQALQPLITAHSVIDVQKKGAEHFQDRWQKIADQSLKQCERLHRMKVLPPQPLVPYLAQTPSTIKRIRLWCDETRARNQTGSSILSEAQKLGTQEVHLLIGPEGGWSEEERTLLSREDASSPHAVHLGPLILRAETAAIFGMSILNAVLGKENS